MSSPPGVLCVALDAVDPGVARAMAEAGELPVLRRLLRECAVAETVSPDGVYVSAHWPTFFTARRPDRHRYLCWKQLVPHTYQDALTTPLMIEGRPLWEQLSDAGRRVAVFDVPHAVVPPALNGVIVAEWGAHDRHFGTRSFPAALAGALTARFGAHVGQRPPPAPAMDQFAPCDYEHRSAAHRSSEESEALWADLRDGQARKEAASLHLLDREDWDLFWTVLGEGHCVGHQFWKVHDPAHPWHDRELRARLGDPVTDMYRRLDRTVGAHLERAGPDTTVFVNLSHGMGPHYDGTHLLDEVLRRLGWWWLTGGGRARALRGAAGRGLAAASRVAPGAVAPAVARWHRRREDPQDLGVDPDPAADDRDARPWFAIPNNTVVGAIRLNVIGREPSGVLAPGADANEAASLVQRWLGELLDADSGERVVEAVERSDRSYARDADDALPDLFVHWSRRSLIERVWSPRIGLVERACTHWRTGDHTPVGLLLARGPGITPGPVPGPVEIADLGATVAAAAGVVLDDVDGVPVAPLVPEPHRRRVAPLDHQRRSAPSPIRTRVRPLAGRMGVSRLAARTAQQLLDRSRRLDALEREHRHTRAVADHGATVAEEALALARHLSGAIGHDEQRLEEVQSLIGDLQRHAAIETVTRWVRTAEVPPEVLVSVVLPTRDRAELVSRAIASVLAQEYERFELLVVDDGSRDDTPELLARSTDDRIRVLRTHGVGSAAARNRALEKAGGDVVAYLDDDNWLDPLWLKAVVWALSQRPDVDVVYGARVIDDIDRVVGRAPGCLPQVQFQPFDRHVLEQANFADMGVIAHRRGLPEGGFDETLHAHADWDLFLRLTERTPPLALPVVACYYTSSARNRLSDLDRSDEAAVRAKLARRRVGRE